MNRQRRVRVAVDPLNRFLASLQPSAAAGASVTVCLVTNRAIARWNLRYRGKRKPTDVLSFPLSDEKAARGRRRSGSARRMAGGRSPAGEAAREKYSRAYAGEYLGDLAIAPEVARRNAARYGRPLEMELRVLILHGVLHLLGYDHETDNGRMDRREQRLRRHFGLK